MRISDDSIINAITRTISTVREDYERKQIQISTGRAYVQRSDDPVAATDASQLAREKTAQGQWATNVDSALTWSRVTEGSLTEILSSLQRARELGVQANDGTQPVTNYDNIAEEVDGIIEDLLIFSSTKYANGYLFSGTDADTKPFAATRDVDGTITAVTYQGTGTKRNVQVGDGVTTTYGELAGGTDGALEATAKGVDTFGALITLRDELRAGAAPADTTLQGIQDSLDHVLEKVVDNGIEQRRFTRLNENITTVDLSLHQRLAAVQEVDIAQALTEMSDLESSLQASLQMAARIGKFSLLDFI